MSELKPVYVVSAPSGAGKTTLNRLLVKRHPNIEISVSLTTRAPRSGEVAGKDYQFVSKEDFQKHIDRGDMLEWAMVHGNLYGTSKQQLREIQARNHYSLLEIDVQGWSTAKRKLKQAVAIFILPPSIRELWNRLEERGTDSLATRWERLVNAKDEIENAQNYDFFIVNDDLDRAYAELESIIVYGKTGTLGPSEGLAKCRSLIEEFENSEWIKTLKSSVQKDD